MLITSILFLRCKAIAFLFAKIVLNKEFGKLVRRERTRVRFHVLLFKAMPFVWVAWNQLKFKWRETFASPFQKHLGQRNKEDLLIYSWKKQLLTQLLKCLFLPSSTFDIEMGIFKYFVRANFARLSQKNFQKEKSCCASIEKYRM